MLVHIKRKLESVGPLVRRGRMGLQTEPAEVEALALGILAALAVEVEADLLPIVRVLALLVSARRVRVSLSCCAGSSLQVASRIWTLVRWRNSECCSLSHKWQDERHGR